VLLIVSSPSGAGKTTLCNKLLQEFSDIRFSVSHTTRPARHNEVDGRDYHFVDHETFDELVAQSAFIEWANVHANRYGTTHKEIERAETEDKDIIFDIDYQGAQQIKQHYPEAVSVFVLPPSIGELHRRLRSRGTEDEQSLETRFRAALEEIGHHQFFDYLVVNDTIETAYDKLHSILVAERARHARIAHLADAMLQG